MRRHIPRQRCRPLPLRNSSRRPLRTERRTAAYSPPHVRSNPLAFARYGRAVILQLYLQQRQSSDGNAGLSTTLTSLPHSPLSSPTHATSHPTLPPRNSPPAYDHAPALPSSPLLGSHKLSNDEPYHMLRCATIPLRQLAPRHQFLLVSRSYFFLAVHTFSAFVLALPDLLFLLDASYTAASHPAQAEEVASCAPPASAEITTNLAHVTLRKRLALCLAQHPRTALVYLTHHSRVSVALDYE